MVAANLDRQAILDPAESVGTIFTPLLHPIKPDTIILTAAITLENTIILPAALTFMDTIILSHPTPHLMHMVLMARMAL